MTEATDKLGIFEKALDGVISKWKSIFGGGGEPAIEVRTEPSLPDPVPTDDEMNAVLARAAAAQKRLADKGLVEA